MSNRHSHDHLHRRHHEEGNIGWAFFLNFSFTIIEVIGGIWTNSLAILSDALHDLGDSLALGLAWYFQRLSKKDRDQRFSYGYGRFSLLGALINSTILVVGSVVILAHAIPEILQPEPTNSLGMMWLAVLGVIVNSLAVFNLKKGKSLNEKVVRLHLLEDVFGWIAVLIGAAIIYFTHWYFIDALLSIGIAGWILWNAWKNLRHSLKIFLQSIPDTVDLKSIHNTLLAHPAIRDVHDCHIWTMDGEYNILSIHLIIDENSTLSEQAVIKKEAKHMLKDENIDHITIEFEGQEEECDSC
jgi:cobalt-zinc-cadmium efflux system protein